MPRFTFIPELRAKIAANLMRQTGAAAEATDEAISRWENMADAKTPLHSGVFAYLDEIRDQVLATDPSPEDD